MSADHLRSVLAEVTKGTPLARKPPRWPPLPPTKAQFAQMRASLLCSRGMNGEPLRSEQQVREERARRG